MTDATLAPHLASVNGCAGGRGTSPAPEPVRSLSIPGRISSKVPILSVFRLVSCSARDSNPEPAGLGSSHRERTASQAQEGSTAIGGARSTHATPCDPIGVLPCPCPVRPQPTRSTP